MVLIYWRWKAIQPYLDCVSKSTIHQFISSSCYLSQGRQPIAGQHHCSAVLLSMLWKVKIYSKLVTAPNDPLSHLWQQQLQLNICDKMRLSPLHYCGGILFHSSSQNCFNSVMLEGFPAQNAQVQISRPSFNFFWAIVTVGMMLLMWNAVLALNQPMSSPQKKYY